LGEYHAAEQVVRDPGLLARLFAGAADHQRVQTLTVLARAAVSHANEGRLDTAHTVIAQLRAVLHAAPADAPLTAAVLRAHSDALPAKSHVLRDYALDVASGLSRLCGATGDEPGALRDRAWALHNLAERHQAVGNRADAVAAASEAATIRERLAGDAGTTTNRTEWADSLVVLSLALRRTGRIQESYRAGTRALELFRALAAEDGEDREKRERGLVRALLNQSQVVWWLDPATIRFDQIARSDDYTDEALRRARDLADAHPDLDPLLLTDALTQRASNLWSRERRPEALSPSEEAVGTARQLAGENPDAYTRDLANALVVLAVDITNVRPAEEVMALEREAIALLRPLVADLPEVHRGLLAQTLTYLAWDQSDEGEEAAARVSLGEAIEHRRAQADNPYGLGVPELASAMQQLAGIDAKVGDHQTAVAHLQEALELYANATLPLTMDDLMRQSAVALDLARSHAALGRTTDALAAVTRAGVIRRGLSEYAPSLYARGYASTLRDLAEMYREQSHLIPQRIVLRHALQLRVQLADAGAEGRAELGWCLHALGASYLAGWPTADRAVTRLWEAYELFVDLSAEDAAYAADLANVCADLARALLKTSRFPAAVRMAEREVRLRRGTPDQEWALCRALLRLAVGLTMAGRQAAAWHTVLEAETVCLALADRPGQQPADVARLLNELAGAMSRCGRYDVRRAARAVPHARRAAHLYRRLVDEHPSEYQGALRGAVNTLSTALTRLGRHAEAMDAQRSRGA
jgi:tetratricopeptide (TPR) repeat protein